MTEDWIPGQARNDNARKTGSRIKSGMTMRGFRIQIELVGISMSFLQKQESRVSNGLWIPGSQE